MEFKDKTIFVAGGSSGVNLAIAERFSAAGARVAILSRNEEKIQAATNLLEKHGGEVLGFSADVREFDAVERAMKQTYDAWGEIDVLISGAAGNFYAPASELSANGFKTVIDIDLLGTFNVMRAAYGYLRKPGAAVMNITAPQAWLPTENQVHACAAKAGIDQVTRTCALEWGSLGIRVNAIAPGPIADTEGMKRLAPTHASEKAWENAVPLKRYGSKEEIAAAVQWLCSKEAAYVTGAVLPVDGGFSLGGSSGMTAAARV